MHPRARAVLIFLGVCVLVTLPVVLPVLPANLSGGTAAVDPVQIETIGWPQFVGTVNHVWYQLPAAQRAAAVIFTGNYGEAGAINELGRADHLPEAVSGQNTVWFWGPGNPRASTVVAVVQGGYTPLVAMLRRDFAHVRIVATLGNPAHVANQEEGGHVYLCTGPVRSWGQLWPSFPPLQLSSPAGRRSSRAFRPALASLLSRRRRLRPGAGRRCRICPHDRRGRVAYSRCRPSRTRRRISGPTGG